MPCPTDRSKTAAGVSGGYRPGARIRIRTSDFLQESLLVTSVKGCQEIPERDREPKMAIFKISM